MTITDDRAATTATAGVGGESHGRPGRTIRYPIGQHPDAPPGHLHPNPATCYRYGCQQPSCRDHHRARSREQHRYAARVRGRIAPEQVRAHISMLVDQGATLWTIARDAGVRYESVRRAVDSTRGLTNDVARKIIALRATGPLDTIDAAPSRRRLQALCAIGWTQRELATRLGMNISHLSELAAGTYKHPTVRIARHEAIRDLYEQLEHGCPCPHRHILAVARNRGWHPPEWWDDIDAGTRFELDDEAISDDIRITVERGGTVDAALTILGVRTEQAARIREQWVEDLTRDGYCASEVARTVGVADRTVSRILARLRSLGVDVHSGRNGVWDRAA